MNTNEPPPSDQTETPTSPDPQADTGTSEDNTIAPSQSLAITTSETDDDLQPSTESTAAPAPSKRESKREARRLAYYADLRREQYESLTALLDTLNRVDNLPDETLAQMRDAIFHADHPFLLTLVGPFSSGKSSVINALLGDAVLEVGPIPTTDHIAILRYGENVQKSRTGNISTIFYPANLLRRLSLVDTPGLESVFTQHDELTQRFLHRADILFLVMIATQVLTASDLAFMRSLKDYGKRMVIIVNQIDVLDAEDREAVRAFVREQSRLHLGIEPLIWLASAKQALQAYQTANGTRDEIQWDESGLADIEEYLDETLNDAQRVHQKLETPLLVARNALRQSLEEVKHSQDALSEHRKLVENISGQIAASEKDRQRLVDKTIEEITNEWQDATTHGTEAIDELFQISRAMGQSLAGFLEIIGLGGLLRRFRKQTKAQEAFARHEVRDSLQRIPEITNRLGPALEGRDQEEIDHLVDYTRGQINQLPTNLQNKVIGRVQSPANYNRKALRSIRNDLDDLMVKAGHFETERIDRALRGTIVTMAFWMFLVIIMAILIGTGAILSGGSGIFNVIIILVMAIFGLGMLPLRGLWLKANYRNKMNSLQHRYTSILKRAGEDQIGYGNQLRQDVVAPFTRMISTQIEHTDELKRQLDVHEQTIIGLQQKLSGLLKD
ncbi:MAG: hypothetical protein GYB66_13555 [Chloroflexi bacterium]|nr:hypothetical protein [Chloroflexota bacterium]